ncbi:sensor histidine kinase [Agromyces sp. NPDC055661]
MTRVERIVPMIAAAAFLVIGVAEILLDPGFRADPIAPAAGVVVVVTGTLIAGWFPIAGTVVVAAMFPVTTALGLSGPSGLGVLAFFLLPGWAAYLRPPRRSWIAPAGAQVMATLGVFLASAGSTDAAGPTGADAVLATVWENLFFSAICWASWGVGLLARRASHRAAQLSRLAAALDAEREAAERAAVVRERQRIAREIHDAVAHSVSVMTLQVGAVRSTLQPDAPQAEMLLGIERLGRESVAELRAVVGILRQADDASPAAPPSLDRLDELLDDVRAAGLPVELVVEGDRTDLARAVDVSAYRVVQEALTNVLRHAGPVRTEVTVVRSGGGVTVEVANAPGAPTATTTLAAVGTNARPADRHPAREEPGGGNGLIGMRERVAMFAGDFSAGPTPDGGFRVRAGFPGVVG